MQRFDPKIHHNVKKLLCTTNPKISSMFTSLLILLIIVLKSNTKASTIGQFTDKSNQFLSVVLTLMKNKRQRIKQKNIFVENKQ